MSTTETIPARVPPDAVKDLAHVDRIARLLDTRYGIPGTRLRFGLDSILGLIPGLGDAVTFGPAVWMIYTAWKHDVRGTTLARMGANSFIDLTIGGIPILGDIFDLFFKANIRNAALLRRELHQRIDGSN